MRLVVSACLLGHRCKYSGGSNIDDRLMAALRGHVVIAVCPEQLGGLPTPRLRCEIRGGDVVDELGGSLGSEYRAGAGRAWDIVKAAGGCDLAVLQPRSPSCGVGAVYDGTFTGKLVAGDGIFVRLLEARGIPAVTPDQFLADRS